MKFDQNTIVSLIMFLAGAVGNYLVTVPQGHDFSWFAFVGTTLLALGSWLTTYQEQQKTKAIEEQANIAKKTTNY